MTSWQKRLRIGLAIFGIVFAGLVYRSIGERRVPPTPEPINRLDPKAIYEGQQTVLRAILLVIDHNAYHVGQIVSVRKALGSWGG